MNFPIIFNYGTIVNIFFRLNKPTHKFKKEDRKSELWEVRK